MRTKGARPGDRWFWGWSVVGLALIVGSGYAVWSITAIVPVTIGVIGAVVLDRRNGVYGR